MTRLILDSAATAKLQPFVNRVEICDPSARTLGFFTPLPDRSLDEGVNCPVSDEELTRRERTEPSSATAEVPAHLTGRDSRP